MNAWSARVAALVVCAAGAGCSLSTRRAPERAPGETDLQVWVPPVVRWETGRGRHVDLAIENATERTVALSAPDPAQAGVEIFLSGPERVRACGVEPSVAGEAVPTRKVLLAPGDQVSVRVDLGAACAGLAPGEYRYEIAYRAPPLEGENAFSGALPARFGELVVSGPAAAADAGRPAPRRARRPPHR